MSGSFDFAPNSHVAEEIPPEQPGAVSMNGWDFTAKPSIILVSAPPHEAHPITRSGEFDHGEDEGDGEADR